MNNETVGESIISIRFTVTADDMENIACDAAMIGGEWWHTLYYDKETRRITAIILDPNADESAVDWDEGAARGDGFVLDHLSGDDIANAIAKAVTDGWDTKYPNGALIEFAATGEFGGGYDSIVADGILQYAVLGEIVYG